VVLLTKSRFKLALSCPTKLYYYQRDEYENIQKEDKFLEALAEGGYQVGELAKCYFPGGFDVAPPRFFFDLGFEGGAFSQPGLKINQGRKGKLK